MMTFLNSILGYVLMISVCVALKCEIGSIHEEVTWKDVSECGGMDDATLPRSTGRSEGDDEGLLRGLLRMVRVCVLRTDCYRRRLLTALDRALESDSLRLADGVYLVKEHHLEERLDSGDLNEPFLRAFARRLVRLLETRALRARLGVMRDTVSQARGLRGYRHAFPLLVGSFMLLAAITVPMGFQFLAVVGGKALILSQIALFMALGGQLQRYLGWGAAAPVGGYVHPHPWHREDIENDVTHQSVTSPQQPLITRHQLLGYMTQRA